MKDRRPALVMPFALSPGLVIATALAAACSPAPPAPAPPPHDQSALEIEMPGPARGRGAEAVALNEGCERCHTTEAREWRASLHQRADLEPTYRRAFAIEPLPFCRGCHAPEATPDAPESAAVAALGVGCVTCHVSGGAVLAAPWTRPEAPPSAPHAIARDPRFAGDGACARCHEFGFPGTRGKETHEKMQWTMTEHARSGAAAIACAGCHMPANASGRKSHVFAASRDPAMLARAVQIAAEREGASRVRVVLRPEHLGHAFPTGDLFRRVEVLAQTEGPDHIVLSSDARYLGRHFELRSGSPGRRLVRDDRVLGEPVTVVLELGAIAAGRPIAYRVAYQRVEHPNGVDEEDVSLDGEVVLAQGVLAPATEKPPP